MTTRSKRGASKSIKLPPEIESSVINDNAASSNCAENESSGGSKLDFSKFKFEPKQKLKLNSTSPKKREHIKLEYEESSATKIKRENDGEIENKTHLKTEIKTEHDPGKPMLWERVLKNLREMRKNKDAPVDSMGTQKCPDENELPQVCTALKTFIHF